MPPANGFKGKVNLDFALDASSNLPAFLYPCQIETRLFDLNRKLKIRIYPDQIAISRIEKQLSEDDFPASGQEKNGPSRLEGKFK